MYPERVATLGICSHRQDYLVLRIAREWKYCPGDWDFVIATFDEPQKPPSHNVLSSVRKHTGLDARIIKEYPILHWPDHESKVLFMLFPFLLSVDKRTVQLSSKFCEVKWVSRYDEILKLDRQNYLQTVLGNTILIKSIN